MVDLDEGLPLTLTLSRGERGLLRARERERGMKMADTTVTTRKNGPLMVQGGIKIMDADGNEIAIDGDSEMVFLCRCGKSDNKPFCDGTHRPAGFEA